MQTWIEECFKSAQASLLVISRDNELDDLNDCQSIHDIYAVSKEIQILQAAHEGLCALGRIEAYIKNVHEFVEVIELLTSIRKDRLFILWVRTCSICILFSPRIVRYSLVSDITQSFVEFSQTSSAGKTDDFSPMKPS